MRSRAAEKSFPRNLLGAPARAPSVGRDAEARSRLARGRGAPSLRGASRSDAAGARAVHGRDGRAERKARAAPLLTGPRPWLPWRAAARAAAMSTDRVAIVEGRLDAFLSSAVPAARRRAPDEALVPDGSLTVAGALLLFEDQLLSRAVDVVARELKREGLSYYTISSAGHEQNAVLGAQLRVNDPCFLHYRSGALMMARLRQVPGSTPLFDALLSVCASRDDPTSGGRHKVWGSRAAWTPPQTSTIASHLPKAVGAAFALARRRRLAAGGARLAGPDLPPDAIVACSFGDATVNHATALAGINAARYAARVGTPAPILFVCEDNGVGISVPTPPRWIEDLHANAPFLRYFAARGELDEVWQTARAAIGVCRAERVPVFLHLPCVRLWGHAGTDVESTYLSAEEIERNEAGDPLLANARWLVERGAASPEELRALVADVRARARAAGREAAARPKLASAAEVLAPLAPVEPERWRAAATRAIDPERRRRAFGARLPEDAESPTRRTLGAHLNHALADELARRDELVVFGEDVGKKGGVYGVTQRLQERFGPARVFDTLLDETTILGLAQGAGLLGLLPVAEIAYLAYVHNAVDQLRGEACSLQYFSAGQFANPMLVRMGAFAYQKGFGGHFHNDDSIGGLRDIPGLVLCAPSRGDDAARLLRGALALASESGRVVVYLEPIALYHERDLYESGDGAWLFDYPPPDGTRESALLPGDVGLYREEERDVLLVGYANGLRLALRAARRLEREHGIRARVLDLRWLAPLPFEAIEAHAAPCAATVVVDECRATGGGVADAIVAHLAERGYRGKLGSVRALDGYVPLGPAADLLLVREESIVERVREVVA